MLRDRSQAQVWADCEKRGGDIKDNEKEEGTKREKKCECVWSQGALLLELGVNTHTDAVYTTMKHLSANK